MLPGNPIPNEANGGGDGPRSAASLLSSERRRPLFASPTPAGGGNRKSSTTTLVTPSKLTPAASPAQLGGSSVLMSDDSFSSTGGGRGNQRSRLSINTSPNNNNNNDSSIIDDGAATPSSVSSPMGSSVRSGLARQSSIGRKPRRNLDDSKEFDDIGEDMSGEMSSGSNLRLFSFSGRRASRAQSISSTASPIVGGGAGGAGGSIGTATVLMGGETSTLRTVSPTTASLGTTRNNNNNNSLNISGNLGSTINSNSSNNNNNNNNADSFRKNNMPTAFSQQQKQGGSTAGPTVAAVAKPHRGYLVPHAGKTRGNRRTIPSKNAVAPTSDENDGTIKEEDEEGFRSAPVSTLAIFFLSLLPAFVRNRLAFPKTRKALNRSELETHILIAQVCLTIFAVLGSVFALVEDTMCFRTCVYDSVTQTCALPEDAFGDASSSIATCPGQSALKVNMMKAGQTLTTLVACFLLVARYSLQAKHAALRRHSLRNWPLNNTSWYDLDLLFSFIVEFTILIVHCPPGVSFHMDLALGQAVALYRIEAITTSWMLLRIYHCWRAYEMYAFLEYQARDAAARRFSTKVNSFFALKAAIHSKPVISIGFAFVAYLMLAAYLIRLAESPVQVELPGSFWNSVWFVAVTMTSTGYGDYYPTSQIGRFIAVWCMIVGAVVSAILTAAVYGNLSFTASEFMTLSFLTSRNWHEGTISRSAIAIQRMWKLGLSHPKTKKAIAELQAYRREYFEWKQSEPHVGKLLQDAVHATKDLMLKMKHLGLTVRRLHYIEVDRLTYVQKCNEDRLRRIEEQQERYAAQKDQPEATSRDMVAMLEQMESQRRIIEQLLRSVVFLSASRKKDNEELKKEIEGLLDKARIVKEHRAKKMKKENATYLATTDIGAAATAAAGGKSL